MSNIVINDLTEIVILDGKSMTRIQGGMNYPVESDGGNGGPGPGPLPEHYSPVDVDRMRGWMFSQQDFMPSTPKPFPGIGWPF